MTGAWWRRRAGADHVLVQAAPVTGFRHPKGRRGFAHYMLQLTRPIFVSEPRALARFDGGRG